MKVLRAGIAAAATAALAVSLTSCAPSSPEGAEGATALRLVTGVDNDTFDPAQLGGGARDNYWQAVYDTVLKLDYETATPEANLATEWSYDETNTDLSITLRDDVIFTDGSPLDAEAVRTSAIALRDGGGTNSIMMGNLEDVEVLSGTELVYHLTQPDPAFLGYLTVMGGAVANPEAVGTEGLATTPAGSGPYVLDTDRTVAGSTYTFTRNEDYWNEDAFPYDEVVLTPITEASAAVNAVRSDQVDGGVFDPTSQTELESAGLEVGTNPVDWRGLMLVDREGVKTPALADVRVRQAINYALDAEGYLENVEQGRGVATSQIFIPGDYGYVEELDDLYPYDPDRARQLLAEAGYPDGFDLVMPAYDFRSAVQPIMVQQLADVGIRVSLQQVVPGEYNVVMRSGEFSAFWIQLTSGDPWRNLAKNLPADASWNAFDTEDPQLASLIAAAREAYGDEPAYRAAMEDIGTFVTENAYFAAWYRIDSLFVTDGSFTYTFTPWATTPELRTYAPAS